MSKPQPEPLRLHIRSRPGMYIGGANPRGLLEILDGIVTGFLALPGKQPDCVRCGFGADGTYAVELRGGAAGAVEPGDFEADTGEFGADDARPALRIASAFSDRLDAEVVREDGRRWARAFAAGLPTGPPEVGMTAGPSGLRIRYRPDPAVFPAGTALGFLTACGRAREWAAFHPHVRITVEQEGDAQRRDFHYPAGLLSLAQEVEHQWWEWPWRGGASNVWRCAMTEGSEAAEAVLVRRPVGPAVVHAFVNGRRTLAEGSQVEGLRSGVAAVAASCRGDDPATNPFAPRERPDPLANLTVLLAVRLDDPQYQYSTRDVLVGDRPRDLVRRTIIATLPGEIRRSAAGRSPTA